MLTRVDVPRRYVPDMVHVATEPDTSTELLVRRPWPPFVPLLLFVHVCTELRPGVRLHRAHAWNSLSRENGSVSVLEDLLFSGYQETGGFQSLLYFQVFRLGTVCTVFATRALFRGC
jgi:hypothetical protein